MLATLLGGCGDRLVSAEAYEAPLLTLKGTLNPVPEDLTSPRVGIVWVDPAGLLDDLPEPATDSQFELQETASYVYSVFAPPPAAMIREIPDPKTGAVAARFAFGEIILYEDRDGDGTFRVGALAYGSPIVSDDDYRGAQAQYFALYIEKSAAPSQAPPELVWTLPEAPGYHVGAVDCSTPDVPQTWVSDDAASQIEVTVLPTPTSQLPYLRKCLRSHPVAPGAGGPSTP
jgi:hypothetical protein